MEFGQRDNTYIIIALWTACTVGVCVSLAVLETLLKVPAAQ